MSFSLLDPAQDAARASMIVCRHVRDQLDELVHMTKDDHSPVTVADFASQAIVSAILAEHDASIPLVAEESADFLRLPNHAAHLAATVKALRDSGVWPDARERDVLDAVDRGAASADPQRGFWTLDPVDGTKGFLRGGQYCVSLAFIQGSSPRVGVLGCPNLAPDPRTSPELSSRVGSMYWAIEGDGAMMAFDQGESTIETDLGRGEVEPPALPRLAESFEAAHTSHSVAADVMLQACLQGVAPAIRIDSQCKYALIARGDADVYLRLPSKKGYVERIWDHAAGILIAQQAGCTVTDALGQTLDFSKGRGLEANRGVIGAPPKLHHALIAALAKMAPKHSAQA